MYNLSSFVHGEVITEVDSVRYLGHITSVNGIDDKDIMFQCQQFYVCGNVFNKNISHVLFGCESEIV